MDAEFEVINDKDQLLERLSHRDPHNNIALYSTEIGSFITDERFFNAFIGESFFKDRHALFESIVIRGGNILALDSHISRIFKGMESVKLPPPFSKEEAKDVIVKL